MTRCYTRLMPTTRKRHLLTETDQLAAALDDAAQMWPADRDHRARLLLRLVTEGHRAVVAQRTRTSEERLEALRASSGAASGMYGPGYLEELRADWPE